MQKASHFPGHVTPHLYIVCFGKLCIFFLIFLHTINCTIEGVFAPEHFDKLHWIYGCLWKTIVICFFDFKSKKYYHHQRFVVHSTSIVRVWDGFVENVYDNRWDNLILQRDGKKNATKMFRNNNIFRFPLLIGFLFITLQMLANTVSVCICIYTVLYTVVSGIYIRIYL